MFVPLRRRSDFSAPLLLLGVWLSSVACQSYADQVHRGQSYYEQNLYEQSLAVWRHLEKDLDSLGAAERVRYCYLRGMSGYRLEAKEDARYWLSLARAGSRKTKGALEEDELARLEHALGELNAEVYASLGGNQSPGEALSCQWSTDCPEDSVCQQGICNKIE